MNLPDIRAASKTSGMLTAFGGLNTLPSAGEGEFSQMTNLSARAYPFLQTPRAAQPGTRVAKSRRRYRRGRRPDLGRRHNPLQKRHANRHRGGGRKTVRAHGRAAARLAG